MESARHVVSLLIKSQIIVVSVFRIALATVFAFAAFAHLQNPFLTLHHILGYRLVTGTAALVVAVVLPFWELSIAAFLFSSLRRGVYLLTLTTLLGFTVAQTSVLIRGIDVDCGCFGGVIDRKVDFSSLLFLLFGICTVLICAWLENRTAFRAKTFLNGNDEKDISDNQCADMVSKPFSGRLL